MRAPALRLAAIFATLTPSCGGSAPTALPPPAPAAEAARAAAAPPPPVRYLVPGAHRIERSDDGADRVIIDGRRMELRGVELHRLGPAEPELQGGGVAPRWAGAGPNRYVFWKGRELYGAATFAGELHRITTLPAEPQRTFDWLGGTGLHLPGGALVVSPLGGRPTPLGVPAVLRAVAADARRALALDALGGAWLTLDGGGAFRDIRADLGTIAQLEVRGEAIAVGLGDGRERFIGRSGALEDRRGGPADAAGALLDEDLDLWPSGGESGALEVAVRSGLPLPDGGVILTAPGFVGRFDPRAFRTTSVAPLGELAGKEAECFAFRARDADLLACADHERATVIDLGGAPRVERTFDLGGAPELDRFLGADGEALGFLGPCEGRASKLAAGDPASGNDAPSPSKSEVFCVRKARDEWIEHRLDPADAADVVAWIPRVGGDAAALVARPGAFLAEAERVSVRGGLRIVRVARSEPPLTFNGYSPRAAVVLDRSLIIHADDSIEGFLPGSSTTEAVPALGIDARGRVRVYPGPQRTSTLVSAGRFALAHSEEGRLFETVDFGRRWIEVPPPPGASSQAPAHCSPAGCSIGSFVRLGWTDKGSGDPAADPREEPRERAFSQRPQPIPAVRLACSFDGPAEGKRSAEPYGFGYSGGAPQRGMIAVRIGAIGAATAPWSNGAAMAAQGDVELGWITPLDPAGAVHRRTLPLARAGLSAGSPRLREMRLGYLLDPEGGLGLLPIGYRDLCPATLLELAGLVRPLGGCVEDRAVGVDLGGSTLVLRPAYDALVTSLAAERGALHELHRTPLPGGLRSFAFGAGTRDGQPVVLVLDVSGEALLAPIDPALGTLGAEERLPPLTTAALGSDPSCAGGQRPGEARVVLPFEGAVGLDRRALPGVLTTSGGGVAVLRWSPRRVCLDAVEIAVRDERYEPDLGLYEGAGAVRKLIARFASPSGARPRTRPAPAGDRRPSSAALVLIGQGYELRQPLRCTGLVPAEPPAP